MLVDTKKIKESKRLGGKYITFDISNTPYSRDELLNGLPKFKEFMAKWQCGSNLMLEAIYALGISDKSLFDYSLWGSDFLVEKDVYYSERCNRSTQYQTIRTDYNVYVCSNRFADLALNEIATYIFNKRFPELNKGNFLEEVKKYNDDIKKLPTSTSAKLSDIGNFLSSELTIQDLIDIYANGKKKDVSEEMTFTSLFTIYADGSIFLKVDKKHDESLYLKIEDFLNKDWNAVEKRYVFSISLYDENGERIKGWFNGDQNDAPYFNYDLVNVLKAWFNK